MQPSIMTYQLALQRRGSEAGSSWPLIFRSQVLSLIVGLPGTTSDDVIVWGDNIHYDSIRMRALGSATIHGSVFQLAPFGRS